MDNAEKTRETRLRRAAQRQGLILTRSRRRDLRALDYGLYWLTDPRGVLMTAEAGTPLDQIERRLLGRTSSGSE